MESLNELFAGADAVGSKYQSDEERDAYQSELNEMLGDIDVVIAEHHEEMAAKETVNAGVLFAPLVHKQTLQSPTEINPSSRWGRLMAAAAKFDGDTEDFSRDVDDLAARIDALQARVDGLAG